MMNNYLNNGQIKKAGACLLLVQWGGRPEHGMDIIQRPADRAKFKRSRIFSFTFIAFHSKQKCPCQIKAITIGNIKYAQWFESCLDPFFFFFFTASDAVEGCLWYFSGFKYRQSHIVVSSYTVIA